jgi:hypothetical protein
MGTKRTKNLQGQGGQPYKHREINEIGHCLFGSYRFVPVFVYTLSASPCREKEHRPRAEATVPAGKPQLRRLGAPVLGIAPALLFNPAPSFALPQIIVSFVGAASSGLMA